MSQGRARARQAKPQQRARLSYRQLRELAESRKAAKSGRTVAEPAVSGTVASPDAAMPKDMPMPAAQEVGQRVSRRDFVRTSAVAAIAAATSLEAMQGALAAKTPEEALNECVAAMKAAAKMPLAKKGDENEAEDVEEWLKRETRGKFKQHFPEWPALKERVKGSSRAIGQIAAILAGLGDRKTIGKHALGDAVKVVKNHCRAGVDPKHDLRPDFVFCPDLA